MGTCVDVRAYLTQPFIIHSTITMFSEIRKEMDPAADASVVAKTERRLVELLFLNSEMSLYALMVVAGGFWWMFTRSLPLFWPTVWAGGLSLLQLVRVWHLRKFLNMPEEERGDYVTHVKIFWLMGCASTLIWSAALLFFYNPLLDSFFVVYAFVTAGIACVAISSLAYVPNTYPIFITIMLLPLSFFFYGKGGMENLFLGTTVVAFIGFGTVLSQRLRKNVTHSISLELANFELAATLQEENSKAEELNAELTREVEKREQTEHELKLAIEEVEAASKAKSDFLAVVSHEIRTPMNGILGMLDLVTDSELNKLQRDYLDTANRSAETLLRLLNDLLDFSKTNQSGLQLERTAFLLKETVEEITSLMAGRAKKKGLKFSFTWDDTAPDWVSGDPIRFRQIIGNLLGNAVKFTEEGAVSVALKRIQREDELIRYFFEIEDTGIGIDAEALKNLFEPFTQADLSMTRKYGGTGLGLAISKQLIELMGGQIEVSSELKGGSKFSFTIVLAEPGAFEIERKLSRADDLRVKDNFCGKVLVVEDDPVNQRVIRLLLERLGLEIHLAENGQVGFDCAVRDNWDLIFMDCQMPVLDGISATRKIRDYEKKHGLSHTPIVALTANAKDTDRMTCNAAGMDDFLAKPVRRPELSGVLETWLQEPSRV